jgi:hypothetical protein
MIRRVLLPLVYLVIGLLVAAQHSYLTHLTTASRILSAVLSILLWPLVLFGVDLTLK